MTFDVAFVKWGFFANLPFGVCINFVPWHKKSRKPVFSVWRDRKRKES